MPDETDSTDAADGGDENTTTSAAARKPWLGTALALVVVPAPWVLAGGLVYLTGETPLWLEGVLAFEAVAGTVWWVGQGAATLARDVVAGLGGE